MVDEERKALALGFTYFTSHASATTHGEGRRTKHQKCNVSALTHQCLPCSKSFYQKGRDDTG
jgi:hypothetical protein